MSDIEQQRRLQILANPTETRTIECKSWLDLSDNKNKAKLAKAAIAMANSGGGTIALGISEDETNGKKLICKPRPSDVARYNSDAVGSAINKYAEPELEPHLVFENHPDTGDEHAFVEIAGGMQQPVFAKKQFDGEIDKLACYIRKPGPPRSEVPHTAQEWRDLMTQCVRANQGSMLDSIRTIMNGRPLDTTPPPSDEQNLIDFMAASKARWQERLKEVDEDDVARLQHGYWAFAFSIVGAPPWQTLNDLRRMLDGARPESLRHRLFEDSTRQGKEPYPADNAVEAWTGNPEADAYRCPYSCSFWHATLGGEFYHLEGFFEDSEYIGPIEPGTRHHHDLSIQLHAMMLMLAARIARSVDEEAEIVFGSEMTGLKGRCLGGSKARWRILPYGPVSSIDNVILQPRRLTPQQIDDNLVEILYDFLHPLYEKFNFYELKIGWVEAAVDEVKRDSW
jgi:hypothetical protein